MKAPRSTRSDGRCSRRAGSTTTSIRQAEPVWRMYRDLTTLRRDDAALGQHARRLAGSTLDDQTLLLRFIGSTAHEDRLVIVNLGPDIDIARVRRSHSSRHPTCSMVGPAGARRIRALRWRRNCGQLPACQARRHRPGHDRLPPDVGAFMNTRPLLQLTSHRAVIDRRTRRSSGSSPTASAATPPAASTDRRCAASTAG